MIQIKKYSEINKEIKDELNSYIDFEFGDIPIVQETAWATPDWTIIHFEDDEIASFYNIIERNIFIDDEEFKVAGINNVITPEAFRGKGYASKILKDTENLIFDELNCELGVLLCADELIPFYERLNWYKVECPVYFNQPDGKKLWNANVMLLSKKNKIEPNHIDLNGFPW